MDAVTILGMALAAAAGGSVAWAIMSRRGSAPAKPSQSPRPYPSDSVTPGDTGPDPIEAENSPAVTRSLPVSLIIQNNAGDNVISVTELPVALFDRVAGKNCRPSKAIGRLNALLQAAPTVTLAAQGVPVNVFEVALNGPLLNAKDSAGNIIDGAYRAITNGGSGGIKEHGLLTKPENLSNAMTAAAVWQVASVVVAQKHLADISQKLDGIVTAINRVEGKLDAQRRGTMMGAMDTLREVSRPILEGEHTPHNRQTLEDQYQKMMDKKHEIHLVLKESIEDLPDRHDAQTFGAADFPQTIREEMVAIETLFQESLLCLRVRLQAWSLLTVLPGEPHLKRERYASIQHDFDQAFAIDGLRGTFGRQVMDLILRVDSKLVFKTTLANHRKELASELHRMQNDLEREIQAERGLLVRSASLLGDATQPTRLMVKTQGNKVIAFKHLPANEMPLLLQQAMQPSVFPAHLLQESRVTAATPPM